MTDEFDITTIDMGSLSTIAQLFKLPQQMIDYLWERIDTAKKKPSCMKKGLAGHVSNSYKLDDPQKLIIPSLYNNVFNQVDNPIMYEFMKTEVTKIYKRINTEGEKIEPYLSDLWVNFQKKGEFQPIHDHSGMFSFVIWMDIPYNYKDEAKLPFAKSNCTPPRGGNFTFTIPDGTSRSVREEIIEMSPEMNGYCCFFPSDLSHQVYPFYTSDKDRISISGNISYRTEEPNPPPVYQFPFHTSET
jgi:hypothetical protein